MVVGTTSADRKGISAAAVGIGIVLWGTITVVEIVRLWRLFRQI